MSGPGIIKLISGGEGEESRSYDVPAEAANLSGLVKECLEGTEDDEDIPEVSLPNVSADTLKMVVEFLNKYIEDPMKEIETPLKSSEMGDLVQEWYANFLDEKRVDQKTLFEVILAANYMNIAPLLDLGCSTVASMMRGRTAEEIREKFNIENDLTPEEEAEIIKNNVWTEEP